jgi:signal transduction histidine kinase
LARLESGSVKKEIVDLYNLISGTGKKYEKQMVERSIQLQISIPKNTTVSADNFFLDIILDNLFSNAIKYGDVNGKIFCDWDESHKTFSISNDGPGITKEQIPLLFNRFYRTDNSRSSQTAGSGLGLSIAKKLSDLQHIEISVRSIPGNTTFLLQFSA